VLPTEACPLNVPNGASQGNGEGAEERRGGEEENVQRVLRREERNTELGFAEGDLRVVPHNDPAAHPAPGGAQALAGDPAAPHRVDASGQGRHGRAQSVHRALLHPSGHLRQGIRARRLGTDEAEPQSTPRRRCRHSGP